MIYMDMYLGDGSYLAYDTNKPTDSDPNDNLSGGGAQGGGNNAGGEGTPIGDPHEGDDGYSGGVD